MLRKEKPRLRADSSSVEAYAGDFSINTTVLLRSRLVTPPPVALEPAEIAALERSITPTRMSTYLSAASGDADLARNLHLWDRELSVAFHADLAILEVALRNAMNAQLVLKWGNLWYADLAVVLDDRTSRQLAEAWGRIPGDKTPGRVVAQCMFGFWRGLLDKGDHFGRAPRRVRCNYEVLLWRGVLDKAFPGGRAQATADNKKWERDYARAVVSRVNDLRNRVSHHEPLINGFPLTGQQVRQTATGSYEDCMRLASMLDRDLKSLLQATSKVPSVLSSRPR